MKYTKADKLGRIVIPISYRKILGIDASTNLKLECKDNLITITPIGERCAVCRERLSSDFKIPLCEKCIQTVKSL